ncbi:MAG TPA: YciI family protein [Thermoanaerobaculia bacterium]|nr:YciI family protein [Thermoanaerobaculia bacterium]
MKKETEMNDTDDGWTQSEREALSAQRLDLAAPEALERAVVKELEARGLLERRRRRPRWLRSVAVLAGAAALFAGGFLAGGRTSRPASSIASSRYVLFLEEDGEPSPAEEERRVREYKLWARRLAAAGHMIAGEKLSAKTWRLGAPEGAGGEDSVGGFFLIAARDDAEALEIARGCPHLRHGGRIVLRKVAPV